MSLSGLSSHLSANTADIVYPFDVCFPNERRSSTSCTQALNHYRTGQLISVVISPAISLLALTINSYQNTGNGRPHWHLPCHSLLPSHIVYHQYSEYPRAVTRPRYGPFHWNSLLTSLMTFQRRTVRTTCVADVRALVASQHRSKTYQCAWVSPAVSVIPTDNSDRGTIAHE